MPCSCQEVETAYSLTQWLSSAAAAASRSDQPIAFGSAVIVSELSERRLSEVVQGARRSHELSHDWSHELSHPLHDRTCPAQ